MQRQKAKRIVKRVITRSKNPLQFDNGQSKEISMAHFWRLVAEKLECTCGKKYRIEYLRECANGHKTNYTISDDLHRAILSVHEGLRNRGQRVVAYLREKRTIKSAAFLFAIFILELMVPGSGVFFS